MVRKPFSRKARPEVLEIVQTGHAVLRNRASLVDPAFIGTDEFEQLIENMIETMREAPGVGIAAPQVGVPLQIFVAEDTAENVDAVGEESASERDRREVPLQVVINPVLEVIDETPLDFFEGCLSVSGYAAVVSRWQAVRVTALDRQGEPLVLEWSGWPARILQHEYDHLQGTLYLDRMNTRTFSTTENLNGPDEDD